jgi:predicted PurR-regulated permease PerM
MNVAEWILVAILSVTLIIFLVVGIVLIIKLMSLSDEIKNVVVESQDIAKNANGIVSNVKGMTSIGGTVEMFVDKYINPKLKEKVKEAKKEEKNGGK